MELQKTKQYRSWIISASIAVIIALWLISGQFSSDGAESAPDTLSLIGNEPGSAVRVRRQAAEEITRIITVNGRTAPARIVELNTETDGRVEAVGVGRGQRVDAGGIIVRLDTRDREARLSEAKAVVRQRELEYVARQRLKSESYVSEAQLAEAAAQLESARAALKRAELDLEYMTIRSPFDGALQERHVEVGDFVAQGDPVATVVDDRTLIVSAGVSEYEAQFVDVGETATAQLVTGESVTGVIRYIAPVADEATRTFTVELEIDNTDGDYRAGVTARLAIPAETLFAQRVSPSLLTLDDEGNLGVKIVNDEGVVEFYNADIAKSSSDGVWIAGLPTVATIITVGQGFVTSGAAVQTVPEDDVDSAVAIKLESREQP
ncbi:MAG: efflux RND transporter periplasmic adaptor subunit [Gammaproteobacteria bacterium]|nr:efflux RND transporter periplasmic adaptor subunit [Gammaproteobacteria bacterium]